MSAVSLTIKALLAESNVTGVTGSRIYPLPIPLLTQLPAIAVSMTGEDEERLLQGASQYPVSLIQVHCTATTAKAAIELGEKVKNALRDKLYETGSTDVDFNKSGPDFTDFNEAQTVHRRVIGFDVRWR